MARKKISKADVTDSFDDEIESDLEKKFKPRKRAKFEAFFGKDPDFLQLTLEVPEDLPLPKREQEPEDAPYNPGLFDVNMGCEEHDPFEY